MFGKRILVTGANGYIGTHVVKELLSQGKEVVACDVCLNDVDNGATLLETDIFSRDNDIYELAGKPDTLIHLAWRNGFKHNLESHIEDLPLHIRFLTKMVNSGIKSLSVMGSMHEVGYFEGAIKADTPTNPLSLYGIAKNALRQYLEILTRNSDVAFHWLRGFYIYGDDTKSSSVLGKIIEAEKNGQEFFPFTSGKNLCDFISVKQLAKQIVAATLQKEYVGIINCCSGKPISLGEVAENFIKQNNYKIKLKYGAFPERAYDSPAVWGDAEIINKIISAKEK